METWMSLSGGTRKRKLYPDFLSAFSISDFAFTYLNSLLVFNPKILQILKILVNP
jgi:hypothetical protein